MSVLIAQVLSEVAKAVLGAFTGQVAAVLVEKIKDTTPEEAYKRALGDAIQRYATSESCLELARPLLRKKGLLARKDVAQELGKLLLLHKGGPDIEVIAKQWRAELSQFPDSDPPDHRVLVAEARRFVDYLRVELENSPTFRYVFEDKWRGRMEERTTASTRSLAEIEVQLARLVELMESRFGELTGSFVRALPTIRDSILDYTSYVEEKTREFVGRSFVFDALASFVDANPRGYFFIIGDPGIGKTALAAQMIRTHNCVHHFNILVEGINSAESFLRNVSAQLIAAYDLGYESLEEKLTENAVFLKSVLHQVGDRLGDRKAIIVVDALDEADLRSRERGSNPLYLPQSLPVGVYIVVTTRREEDCARFTPPLRVECEYDYLCIDQGADDNLRDIREFVEQSCDRPGIQDYLQLRRIKANTFVEQLVAKSQGNFIYLRYVLPEIERGTYKNLRLADVPAGLQNYYEDHWRRMRRQSEHDWFRYKLPVLAALTVVREPVSIDLIARFTGISERARIRSVLEEWSQFLYEESQSNGARQRRYRLYHASFHQFIRNKDQVADEQLDLKEAAKRVSERLHKRFDERYRSGSGAGGRRSRGS
jgi:hypothetical protein